MARRTANRASLFLFPDEGDPLGRFIVAAANTVANHGLKRLSFEAAKLFLQSEGWLIAGESAHAVRAAIDEGIAAEKRGEEKCILVNISGHGFLDIDAYREVLRIE
jgi:predicted alternative tryptophan synthase beta-subunit